MYKRTIRPPMKIIYQSFSIAAVLLCQALTAQTVTIQVDPTKGRKAISPYIYGKNNNISDAPGSPTTPATWKRMRDAGLRMTRENGGNNASKYNWRKKISSHPDWYNNIYNHDWDYQAKTLGDSMPGTQGMWAFQLIGYAASNLNNNFNDWAYDQSSGGGACQNTAGGGTVKPGTGCVAAVAGNTNLYLENWNADSTTAILDHWFGTGGLGLNKNNIKYWSMDNEPDIWNGTHDDVMATQPAAEAFMQLYFSVAKKARAKDPTIKLCGPVPASEWQWYSWNNNKIAVGGNSYTWLEFFIKRISEEETATGIRLLDVIDIHSYPNEANDSDIVQLHRIYFDSLYTYPGANGVKTTAASGWDNTITNENVFGRCNKWLKQYMGPNHGVTFAVSEYGFTANNVNTTATSYASVLGTFADNGVEYFTPWYWYTGQWETLHLFSRYGKPTRIQSISNADHYVSGYSSVSNAGDSITIFLVNRSLTASKTANVNLSNYVIANGSYATKQLSGLPGSETFVSHTSNALKSGTVTVSSNALTLSLPALSTTAIILKGSLLTGTPEITDNRIHANLYPNPVSGQNAFVDLSSENIFDLKLEIFNMLGESVYSKSYAGKNPATLEIPCMSVPQGVYIVSLSAPNGKKWTSRFVKL
jgi:hypothetical protein